LSEDIGYLLGHGAKSIAERYAHVTDALRNAISKLDGKPETQTATETATCTNMVQFPAKTA
jgi:hypothetical protein